MTPSHAVKTRRRYRYYVSGSLIAKEPEPGDRRLDPDFARIEPILQLAAVEHQLQRADPRFSVRNPTKSNGSDPEGDCAKHSWSNP